MTSNDRNLDSPGGLVPGTVLSMQNIYLVKKNYANPLEGDPKPPEGDNSMKFVYHQLNISYQNSEIS